MNTTQEPNKEPNKLKDFCLSQADSIELEDTEVYLKLLRKWAKNRNFYRGNQRGFWDNQKKIWVTVDVDNLTPSEASVLVINNQFRPQAKTLMKEFSRSVASIKASPLSDSQEALMASRFSDALIKYYQHELMPESFRQREAKYLLLCGNAFRYTWYDKNKKSATVKKDVMGNKTVPAYSSHRCIDCAKDYESPQEECECGGMVESLEVEEKTYQNVKVGEEDQETGDLMCEAVDPTEVRVWVGAKTITETPYLRRKRIVREEFITARHPNIKVEDTELSISGRYQKNFMSMTGGKEQQQIEERSENKIYEYDEYWIDKSRFKKDEVLTQDTVIDGITVKAGTPYSVAFSKGMYFVKQSKNILEYRNECKNDHWLHSVYDINIDGFHGDGLEDAIQSQQIINEYNSMGVENVLYNASPKLLINPRLINPATMNGRPRDMIPLSDNARLDTKPDQAFAQIQGMSLTNDVMMGMETSKRDMREQTGALLGFNGQGDPNITTATGISIARDSALALISTSLALTAECNKDWSFMCLSLVQSNWYDEKYKFLLGKYNESEATAFRDCDLKKQISLSIEPYSWLPRTTFEKQQSLNAYLTAFGLPLGFLNPAVPEAVRQYASQLYQMPFEMNEINADMRIAQRRLDKAVKLAETILPALDGIDMQGDEGGVILNNTSVLLSDVMDIEEELDEHPVFIDVYKKWLKTDEGQEANPILRQAIKLKIREHSEFMRAMQVENSMMPPDPSQGGGGNTFSAEAPPEHPFTKTASHRATLADK